MQRNWTIRDRITVKLIGLMKHDENDFLKCEWNDFIIMLMNKFGTDPEELANKMHVVWPKD